MSKKKKNINDLVWGLPKDPPVIVGPVIISYTYDGPIPKIIGPPIREISFNEDGSVNITFEIDKST